MSQRGEMALFILWMLLPQHPTHLPPIVWWLRLISSLPITLLIKTSSYCSGRSKISHLAVHLKLCYASMPHLTLKSLLLFWGAWGGDSSLFLTALLQSLSQHSHRKWEVWKRDWRLFSLTADVLCRSGVHMVPFSLCTFMESSIPDKS